MTYRLEVGHFTMLTVLSKYTFSVYYYCIYIPFVNVLQVLEEKPSQNHSWYFTELMPFNF